MKKLTSIILALTMLLSCALLYGCAAVDPLELEGYSELSLDDKRIVEAYQRSFTYDMAEVYPRWPYAFDKKAGMIEKGEYTFYKTSIGEHYYICGYVAPALKFVLYFSIGVRSENLKWYVVDNEDMIRDEINGMKLSAKYLVYDGVIESDINHKIAVNKKCKFSFAIHDKNRIDEQLTRLNMYDYLLTFDKVDIAAEDGAAMYTGFDVENSYPIYADGNGNELMLIRHTVSHSHSDEKHEVIEDQCGEYYGTLSQYMIFDEKFSERLCIGECGCTIITNVGIDLDVLDLLFGNREAAR